MSYLNGSDALSSPLKRPFEPSHYQSCDFPPNFKRPKVNAVRQFPRGCSTLAPRMRGGRTEGITCMATAPKFENEGQGIAVVSKSLGISVEMDLKSEAARALVLRDEVGAEEKMTLDNVKMRGCGALAPRMWERQTEGIICVAKRRKVDAVGQFPRGCGALAPVMRRRRTESITCMAAAPNCENEGQRIAVVSKPSEISVERDLKSEAARALVSLDEVGAEGKMTLDNVKMKGCSALAPRLWERQTEDITCMAAAPKFENEGQGIAASKPLGISVEKDSKLEAIGALVSCDEVGAEGKMTLHNVKMKLPKALENDGSVNVLQNGSQPKIDVLCCRKSLSTPQYIASDMVEAGKKMIPCNVEVKFRKALKDGLANVLENASKPNIDTLGGMKALSPSQNISKKYPPAKIRKGVTVFRQFPPGCGRIIQHSPSDSGFLAHKFVAEFQPSMESVRFDRSQTRNEIYGADTSGNVMKEFVCKAQARPTSTCNRIHRRVQGGTSSKYDGAPEGLEISTISRAEGDLFQSDCTCQVVGHKIYGGKTPIQRKGKDSIKYVKEWGAEDERSAEMEFPNVAPFFGKSVSTEQQQGKIVFSCKLTDSFEGHKHKELVDVNRKSQDLLEKKQLETRIVSRDSAGEGSLICSRNASDQRIYPLLDDNMECNHIIAASNVPNLAQFDNCQEVVSRSNVREALNQFREILENLSQEPQSILISKGKGQAVRQIHMAAAMVLKNRGKWINANHKKLGPVSGVEVGDQFHFRVELAIVGLHRPLEAGIDYIKRDGKLLATSVVASGRYANHAFSNVLIYSGQGGNQFTKHKRPEDQKLERGNLALKNSMEARTPVRVILGRHQVSKISRIKGTITESIAKTYIYDGLYIVTKYWQERRQHGKLVFMFQLDRIPGQPKLNVRRLRSISGVKWPYRRSKTPGCTNKLSGFIANKSKSKKSGLCKDFQVVDDISQGKEKIPIRAINEIDDEKPPLFNYVTKMIFEDVYNHPNPGGCDCPDGCSDSKECSCALKNGGEIPFNNNGFIIRAKSIVYECGPSCNCPPYCGNRVGQNGIRYQLEVFKTDSRGWGVRSRNYISSGSFICEYIGELLPNKDAEQKTGNDEYLFDIGNGFANDDGFTIDAAQHGNVGRFINHSCSPNLYAQNILYEHEDRRMPRIMLFATRNIPPLQELTFDYSYKVDQVHDLNGNIKKKNCYCGSHECRGRMY